MRLLGPIATTLLVLTCGGDSPAPAVDPAKQAEIGRLGTVVEAFYLIKIELSEIGKGQGIEGTETLGRTVNYSVTLTNPTEHAHLVVYSIHWMARTFIPTDTGVCSHWQNLVGTLPAEIWPDQLLRSEVLQASASVTKPNESSPLPDCLDIDPTSGFADIYEIDGFDISELQYRIAELEGREIDY